MATLVSPVSCFRSSLAAAAAAVAVRFPIARASFRCSSSTEMETEHYKFGAYKIDQREVFYSTHLSYALVNLRPLLPVTCGFQPKKIGKQLEKYHRASSLTFAIQDGPQAGQTVPHVHIHIVPRKGGDFENNDEIYDAIDEKEKELKNTLDLDKKGKIEAWRKWLKRLMNTGSFFLNSCTFFFAYGFCKIYYF
ncbi:putative histidine triad (HIT) protein [Helianthus debilis subsp. tardiflorus]